MANTIELKKDAVGLIQVFTNGVNTGSFDQIGLNEPYCFFIKRNDKINGDDLIAIGHELNKLNASLIQG